jgi:hypothetical protein
MSKGGSPSGCIGALRAPCKYACRGVPRWPPRQHGSLPAGRVPAGRLSGSQGVSSGARVLRMSRRLPLPAWARPASRARGGIELARPRARHHMRRRVLSKSRRFVADESGWGGTGPPETGGGIRRGTGRSRAPRPWDGARGGAGRESPQGRSCERAALRPHYVSYRMPMESRPSGGCGRSGAYRKPISHGIECQSPRWLTEPRQSRKPGVRTHRGAAQTPLRRGQARLLPSSFVSDARAHSGAASPTSQTVRLDKEGAERPCHCSSVPSYGGPEPPGAVRPIASQARH